MVVEAIVWAPEPAYVRLAGPLPLASVAARLIARPRVSKQVNCRLPSVVPALSLTTAVPDTVRRGSPLGSAPGVGVAFVTGAVLSTLTVLAARPVLPATSEHVAVSVSTPSPLEVLLG